MSDKAWRDELLLREYQRFEPADKGAPSWSREYVPVQYSADDLDYYQARFSALAVEAIKCRMENEELTASRRRWRYATAGLLVLLVASLWRWWL